MILLPTTALQPDRSYRAVAPPFARVNNQQPPTINAHHRDHLIQFQFDFHVVNKRLMILAGPPRIPVILT